MNDLETIYVQETKHKVQQYYKVNQIAEIMQVSEKRRKYSYIQMNIIVNLSLYLMKNVIGVKELVNGMITM